MKIAISSKHDLITVQLLEHLLQGLLIKFPAVEPLEGETSVNERAC